jgi:hypothetical protein
VGVGLSTDVLNRRIDEFLGSRGFRQGPGATSGDLPSKSPVEAAIQSAPGGSTKPLDFVCEDDVRQALQAGRKLLVSERAIITPAARELGDQHQVFAMPHWQS